ncbi:hypothetical protein ALI22I_20405 [Saccharothrix sp. ALI-22-I]|uniref:hypothetical protein n=1 Tax=Saccharothrix sp. ALI-22-I TaxID=1933778 RepID=UPI00097BB194|nr:hypothetical protein [Saccharothrix sp. ALI-22-I]ONI88103.1 hypothetical protein ALI22I_20405 [Saccharothrix sp. ALI-22-I]
MPESGINTAARYVTTRRSASAWPKSDPAEPCLIVHRDVLPDLSTPHPLHVLEDGSIGHQAFRNGDPAALLGFQQGATRGPVLSWEQFFADPEAAIGLVVVLVDDQRNVYARPGSPVVRVEHGTARRHGDDQPDDLRATTITDSDSVAAHAAAEAWRPNDVYLAAPTHNPGRCNLPADLCPECLKLEQQ